MRYLLSEIAAVCGGELRGADVSVSRVAIDSRSVAEGAAETLFAAIRTRNRNGAAYVGEAYARGVRAFLVNDDFRGCEAWPEAGFVAVADTVAALQALAAHHRAGFSGRVVGITGSVGKTTVKEWIAQLAPAGVTLFRSPKSWNSQIGVPLSLLAAAGDEDYIVIEAGISERGEMAALQRIIRPDVGILTSIGGAHEQNFASLAELRAEKELLFRDCPAVLRGEGDDFTARCTALAAEFWRAEGYDVPESAIAALEPVAMRLEVKQGAGGAVVVNDTYNSDTASLAIALDHLARVAGDRPRAVVMADVAGAEGDAETYRRVAELVRGSGAARFVGIGTAMTAHAAMFSADGVNDVGGTGGAGNMNGADGTLRAEFRAEFHPSADDFLRSMAPSSLHGHAILLKGGAHAGFDRISRALELRSHTTVLEVDLDAMIRNLNLCRSRLAAGVGVVPMIKAAAYGHGTFEVARTLETQGVDYLAVAFADEGVALREGGVAAPIVVLNADADSFEPMIRHRLEPEIYNFESLDEFTALLKRHGEQRYPVHLKLDTGMHRLGFRATEIERLIRALAAEERYAQVATIFSHLAAADDPAEDDFTRGQIATFDAMSRAVAAALPYPVRRHLANTNGVERFPEAQFDMVRLGVGLYGYEMAGAVPVARLTTRIVHIAEYAAGETVGYGRHGVLARESRIATVPVGYADGLNRHLGCGGWSMLVAGRPAPIVGNVCMDSCMIDVTDIEGVRVGDGATVFSSAAGNTAADMARALDTIPYEVLTAVSSRVKRVYIKE